MRTLAVFLGTLLMSGALWAAPASFIYEGHLYDNSTNTPIANQNVNITVTIYTSNGVQQLYTKSLNVTTQDYGYFSITIDDNSATFSCGLTSLQQVFSPGTFCTQAQNSTATRNLRLTIGGEVFDDVTLNAVPFASYSSVADSALSLLGRPLSATPPTSGQVLKYNGTSWVAGTDDAGAAATDASYTNKGVVQFDSSAATSGIEVTGGVARLAPSGASPGTYTKVTVDIFGRVTGAAALAVGDIPDLSATYLTPLNVSAATPLAWNTGTRTMSLTLPTCSAGQILTSNGTNFSCITDATGGTPGDASYAAKGLVQFNTDATTSGIAVTAGIASLAPSGVVAGSYGDALSVPRISVDNFGRVTNVSLNTISGTVPGGAAGGDLAGTYPNPTVARLIGQPLPGTVVSHDILQSNGTDWESRNIPICTAGQRLTYNGVTWTCQNTVGSLTAGGGISLGGTAEAPSVNLANTGVTAGTYGSPTIIPIITVDPYGRVTSASGTTLDASSISSGILPVNRGGTGSSIFDANRIVGTNATGTAMISFSCAVNDSIRFDALGNAVCSDDAHLASTYFQNGGNVFGGDAILGTDNAQALIFETNATEKMRITATGNVGIGITNPGSRLEASASSSDPNASTARFVLMPTAPGTGTSAAMIAHADRTTSGTANDTIGAWNRVTYSSPASPSGKVFGAYNETTFGGTSTGAQSVGGSYNRLQTSTNIQNGYGSYNEVSGNMTYAYGSKSVVMGGGGSTTAFGAVGVVQAPVPQAHGLNSEVNTSSLPTSIAYGVSTNVMAGSGGTAYGVYIGPLSGGTRYGIYQYDNTAGTRNYMAAPLNLGTSPTGSTPTTWLNIVGPTNPEIKVSDVAGTVKGRLGLTSAASQISGGSLAGSFVLANDSGAVQIGAGSPASNVHVSVIPGGNVGIGTTSPSDKLHVNGNVLADAFNYTSDARKKENIHTLENSLDKVVQLRGVAFDWKKNGKHDMGFIAQEVEQVYPDMVSTDNEGFKSVKYGNLVAPVIEAIKDLFARLQGQSEEVERLKEENAQLKSYLCAKDPAAPFCH